MHAPNMAPAVTWSMGTLTPPLPGSRSRTSPSSTTKMESAFSPWVYTVLPAL